MITVNTEIERISSLHITLCGSAVEQNVVTEQKKDTDLPLFNHEDVLNESKEKMQAKEKSYYQRSIKVVLNGHKKAKVYPDFLTLWKEATGARKEHSGHQKISADVFNRVNATRLDDFPEIIAAYRLVRKTNKWEQIYPVAVVTL